MKHQSAGPAHADRARAILLAHACGDRFGAPLEFVSDVSVRTRTVALGNWTDDTHMALYLGEAILAHGPGPLRPDSFGQAVGDAFVRWLHDPLTPSTAPGSTCLSGARRFGRGRDWRTSGVRESDGCGAVMRVVPLALAFRVAWVDRGEDWLDGGMIPPGDGGWRSGSALGLGVAAALRWSDDLGLAVEKAARIRGDSDSVACLTGALLSAALGTEAIPPAWLAILPRQAEIVGLADRLLAHPSPAARPPSPPCPR